jgi:hypothetical protein
MHEFLTRNFQFFIGRTTVSKIWLFFCLFVVCIFPLVDARQVLATAGKVAWRLFLRRDVSTEAGGNESSLLKSESEAVNETIRAKDSGVVLTTRE